MQELFDEGERTLSESRQARLCALEKFKLWMSGARTVPPPPPQLRAALLLLNEARRSLDQVRGAWHPAQVTAAIKSARELIDDAERVIVRDDVQL